MMRRIFVGDELPGLEDRIGMTYRRSSRTAMLVKTASAMLVNMAIAMDGRHGHGIMDVENAHSLLVSC
jgi:hypothetical protein